MFACYLLELNWTKWFFTQPEVQMNNEFLLKFPRRHTIEAIFQSLRVSVEHRRGKKRLRTVALHLMGNMARPPIYDGVYQERQRNNSPTNLVGVLNCSLGLLFEQLDKKFWKNLIRLLKSVNWHFFGDKSKRETRWQCKLASKLKAVNSAKTVFWFLCYGWHWSMQNVLNLR